MNTFKRCDIELGPESEKLSGQQKAVVLFLGLGLSNKAIGARMHRSAETVKTHVDALLDRFNVESRTAIVSQAFCHGVLKASEQAEKAARATAKCLGLLAIGSLILGSPLQSDDRSVVRRGPRSVRIITAKYQQANLGVLVA